jgi:hypothetical protein
VAVAGVPHATGCAALAGEQEVEATFVVGPKSDGSFFGWTEITISEDASSADGATLTSVRLELPDPPQAEDLTFLQHIAGEAVTPDDRTLVVKQPRFPAGEVPVGLDVVYGGDLRPFFPDGHTIRIEWTGQTNPAYTAWPEKGIPVRVVAKVEIE